MFYVDFPWTTIIIGIVVWTIGAFVLTVLVKLALDRLPHDNVDERIEKQDADSISFQLKRREIESMIVNMQAARQHMKEAEEKVAKIMGVSEDDEDFDER